MSDLLNHLNSVIRQERALKEIWEARAKEWCEKANQLEIENDALKHDIERHISNHAADINAELAKIFNYSDSCPNCGLPVDKKCGCSRGRSVQE